MEKNICQFIVDHLAYQHRVRHIYGITGDALNALTAAIRKNETIQWVTTRHEEAAAFAASAQAELTQNLAVCAGTIGPGAVHLINGLYNAKRDHSPVLALTGQVPRKEMAGPYFQETNQQKLFDDVCVFNETLYSKEQLPRLLHQAIKAAIVQRGVAHLALPTDVTFETIEVSQHSIDKEMQQMAVFPREDSLKEAADLINQAKKPTLLAGCGCRGARSEVRQLAKRLQAPVVHSLKGTEILEYDDPYSIGGVGHVGTPHGMRALEKCDLLIMLGTDFPYPAFLPDHGNIIQINVNALHLGRRCPIKLGVEGNVQLALPKLIPQLDQKSDQTHLMKIQKKRDEWIEKVDKQFAPEQMKAPIRPQSVVLQASELAYNDAIFVGEVGEVTVWVARHLRIRGNQRLIGSFSHGSLGVGLPAAIGAQFAYPERQVIALCGDGAFSMLMGDFMVAVQHNLPLTAVVLNNSKYGFIELEMEAGGFPRFATGLENPNFAQFAKACGGEGIAVEEPGDLKASLSQAFTSKQPTIVDVQVNPTELIIPPDLKPKDAWQFTQGKVKEMFREKDLSVLFEH